LDLANHRQLSIHPGADFSFYLSSPFKQTHKIMTVPIYLYTANGKQLKAVIARQGLVCFDPGVFLPGSKQNQQTTP
jgi:hypothetical protein